MTSPRSGLKAGLAEVTTHVLPITLGWATVVEAFNQDTWNRLDEASQNYLEAKYAQSEAKFYEAVEEETADAYRCLKGETPCNDPGAMKNPLTVATLSDADKTRIREIVKQSVLPGWAERCGEDCVAQWNDSVGKDIDVVIGQ